MSQSQSPRPEGRRSTESSTARAVLKTLVPTFGAFYFGYHLVETNFIKDSFVIPTDPSNAIVSLGIPTAEIEQEFFDRCVAIYAFGVLIGAILGCRLMAKKFSFMRIMLGITAGPAFLGSIMLTFSPNGIAFFFARIVAGIGSGGYLAICPAYINVVTPLRLRGPLGGMTGIGIALGIAVCGLIGIFVDGNYLNRLVLLFPGLLCIPMLFLISCFMRDPDNKQRGARALAVTPAASVNAPPEQPVFQPITLKEILNDYSARRALLVLMMTHMAQQFSGINIFFSFGIDILINVFAGDSRTANRIMIVICFILIVLGILPIIIMNRAGRRIILLTSTMGMSFFCIVLYIGLTNKSSVLSLVGFLFSIISFNVGLSSIPFVLISEMAPTAAHIPLFAELSLAANASSNFIVLLLFSILQGKIHQRFFLLLFVSLSVFTALIALYVPETSHLTALQLMNQPHSSNNAASGNNSPYSRNISSGRHPNDTNPNNSAFSEPGNENESQDNTTNVCEEHHAAVEQSDENTDSENAALVNHSSTGSECVNNAASGASTTPVAVNQRGALPRLSDGPSGSVSATVGELDLHQLENLGEEPMYAIGTISTLSNDEDDILKRAIAQDGVTSSQIVFDCKP